MSVSQAGVWGDNGGRRLAEKAHEEASEQIPTEVQEAARTQVLGNEAHLRAKWLMGKHTWMTRVSTNSLWK